MTSRWPLVLLSVSACLPALHELEGRYCDEAHLCPGDFTCASNVCVSDPPSADPNEDNFLPNPGFESGLNGWRPFNGGSGVSLKIGYSFDGKHSGHVYVLPEARPDLTWWGITAEPGATAVAIGQLFCAEAYVSSSSGRLLSLQIVDDVAVSPREDPGASTIPTGGWSRLRASHRAQSATLGVWLRVTGANPDPDSVFFTDRVRLFSPAVDATCF